MEGAFEVKDVKLLKYCEVVEHTKEHFVEVPLKLVHWAKNHQADELAQLASSLEEWTTQEIVARVDLLHLLEAHSLPEVWDWRQEFLDYF